MATASGSKKMSLMVDLPECPVCLEMLSAPIYLCESGHSVCNPCVEKLKPPVCPRCRRHITKIRSRQLEDLIAKATTSCPNQESGCSFTLRSDHVEDHLKECIFRVMKCPLGKIGRCSWSGAHKEMVDHFRKFHPQNILMNLNQKITINNVSVTEEDCFVFIVPQGRLIYILTLQIDVNQQLVYWVVQFIGSKKVLQQHIYEINIHSLQDNRRNVTFNDYCFSDAMATADIISQSQCFVLSLPFFNKFIYDRKVTFKLNIKYRPAFPRELNIREKQSNINLKRIRDRSPSL